MSNTSAKVAFVFFMVLALPTASFAQGGGSAGMGHSGGATGMGQSGGVGGARPTAGQIGAAQSQVTDPSGMGNASRVAPIPPPRITVPTVPQFK
jgi:hypothetical protein